MVSDSEVEEPVIKSIDPQGRLIIPSGMRKGWRSGKVILIKEGEGIRIVPMEPKPPSAFFDSIPVEEGVDLTDSHAVMKALRGRRPT